MVGDRRLETMWEKCCRVETIGRVALIKLGPRRLSNPELPRSKRSGRRTEAQKDFV
jgi:hypothetical protein